MQVVGPIEALGTVWYLEVEGGLSHEEVEKTARELLESFEQLFSRFRSDSVLSELNRIGVINNPDPQFVDMLIAGIEYYKLTDGVFNIMIGGRLSAHGYDAEYSFTEKNTTDEIPSPLEVLSVTDEKITLQLGEVDIGGYGKGYAIDLLANELAKTFSTAAFLINGGGDIFVGSGFVADQEIMLVHPQDSARSIGSVSLRGQAFAASSPYVRTWRDKVTGEAKHHLITTDAAASYVVSPTAAEADVWATTLAVSDTVLPPATVSFMKIKDSQVIATDPLFQLHQELLQ